MKMQHIRQASPECSSRTISYIDAAIVLYSASANTDTPEKLCERKRKLLDAFVYGVIGIGSARLSDNFPKSTVKACSSMQIASSMLSRWSTWSSRYRCRAHGSRKSCCPRSRYRATGNCLIIVSLTARHSSKIFLDSLLL
jgi:hypothetical protein